ncbi:hypothetical protein ACKWTF_015167 [Chironomus riparius]
MNSILHPIFIDVMDRMIASGVLQYLETFSSEALFGKYQEVEDNLPKVFALDDLSFGFILWIYACGLSISVFLFECLKEVLGLICLLLNLVKSMPHAYLHASHHVYQA